MSLPSYLRLLRESWERVAAFTLIGIIIAMAFALTTTPKFVATSEIFLATPRFSDVISASTSPYAADNFTQQRARSYVSLATREDLARRVVAKLGIDMRPDELVAATSASVRPDTVLIDISVGSSSAAEAKVLADALTAEFARDIRTLESRSGLGVPVVDPIVTQSAEAPKKASEPNVPIYLVNGASVGFLIGISVSAWLARRRLDGTQLEKLTGAPVLGRIATDSPHSENIADGEPLPSSRVRADWNVVQKNVSFELQHSGDRVLAVTTETGSARSSATAAELAWVLARTGQRVVLVSMKPNGPTNFTGDETTEVGLAEVIAGESPLGDAIQSTPEKNLSYLGGLRPEIAGPLLRSDKFRSVVRELRYAFDVIVFDSPDFLKQKDSTLLPEVVDSVIFVTMESNMNKRDLASAIQLLSDCHVRLLGSILEWDAPGRSPRETPLTSVALDGRA